MGSRPDRAFRIADVRHEIFDGMGAFLNGARWNSPKRRVIYAAETVEGAILEVLVHARIGKVPRTQAWIEIKVPRAVSIEELSPRDVPGWDAEESSRAREFGDHWHESRRSLILVVPSVVTSGMGRNILINQDHEDFMMLRATLPRPVVWDARLFEG